MTNHVSTRAKHLLALVFSLAGYGILWKHAGGMGMLGVLLAIWANNIAMNARD